MENIKEGKGINDILNSKIFRPNGRTISAVLFDMDGVLIDSIPLHLKAWSITFTEYDLPCFSKDFYFSILGCKNSELLDKHLAAKKLVLSAEERKQFLIKKEQVFRDLIIQEGKTTPGVKTWLEYLNHQQLPCAVASAATMANIVMVLSTLKLAEFFASALSASILPEGKPNPQIFLAAAASLGVDPENCLVIEDAVSGIRAAKSAKMSCIAAATSFPAKDLSEADYVLTSLQERYPEELFK